MKEYKVIKEFGCAKVNDIFSYREDVAAYWMSAEEDNSSRSMMLSVNYVNSLAEDGFLEELKEEKELNEVDMQSIMKIEAIKCLIEDLKKKYEARNKRVQSKYDAGKMQTCVKVEHDTVHFNLMKLLNQFEKIVNE